MSEVNMCSYGKLTAFEPYLPSKSPATAAVSQHTKQPSNTSYAQEALATGAVVLFSAAALKAHQVYQARQIDNLMDTVVTRTVENLKNEIHDQLDANNRPDLFDSKQFINGSVETMVDGRKNQADLRNILNDPSYSHANFIDTAPGTTGDTFIANFVNNRAVTFSNRESSQNELRSVRLQEMLTNHPYNNLEDIAGADHLTQRDAPLSQSLASVIMSGYSGEEIFTQTELRQLSTEQREEVYRRVREQYHTIPVINGLQLDQFIQI
jgi:hypothetical protein